MNLEKLKVKLNAIGMDAALKHPKAKLWAKVNHEDNFALAVGSDIRDKMTGFISDNVFPATSRCISKDDRECIDWFNEQCNKEFQLMANQIAREAYAKLRA